jgi:DNA helicase IV
VDGDVVVLRPSVVSAARTRARQSRKPHNLARVVFVKEVLADLAHQLAGARDIPLDEENRADLLVELRESRDVRREVNLCWMPLTPFTVVRGLYARPDRLAQAAPGLSTAERALLRREPDAPWTSADVPLLDEAAELLGEDDSSRRADAARADALRQVDVAYARGVLEITGTGDMVSAETLAGRFAPSDTLDSVADRAREDREWAFGHIVVDEAQELSPMQWRLVLRRCPARSLTIVGDVAQTGSAAGAESWHNALAPHLGDRWRLQELTVNYRTPARIMAVASDLLERHGVSAPPQSAARDGEWEPTAWRVQELTAAVIDLVRTELASLGEGRLAVVTAGGGSEPVREALAAAFPDGTVEGADGTLEAPVTVLDVAHVKGLEFDVVVVVEPAAVAAASVRGVNDLYVALTRPTQRLRIVHCEDLPGGLEGLVPTVATPSTPSRTP